MIRLVPFASRLASSEVDSMLFLVDAAIFFFFSVANPDVFVLLENDLLVLYDRAIVQSKLILDVILFHACN